MSKRTAHFSNPDKKRIFRFLETLFKNPAGANAPRQLIKNTPAYHKVFLTVINQGRIRCCQSGQAVPSVPDRLEKDLQSAVKNCLADSRFGKNLTAAELPDCHLVVEFLFNKQPIHKFPRSQLSHQIISGLNALEIVNRDKAAYYKAAVMIEKNLKISAALIKLRKKAHLPYGTLRDPQTKLYKFDTTSFLKKPDGTIIDLFRCNPAVPDSGKITAKVIATHLKLAARWIEHNLNPQTGLPQYAYLPSKKAYSSQINHLRILGLAWAAATLSAKLKDPALEKIAGRTVQEYLKKYAKSGNTAISRPSAKSTRATDLYLQIDRQAKIAYNAFLILALLQLKKFPGRTGLLNRLSEALLSRQLPTGEFLTDFENNSRRGCDFYPGESLLALINLQKTKSKSDRPEKTRPQYLPPFSLAFEYYRDYWRKHQNTAFIPWHTQAWYQLYLQTGDRRLAGFIFEMTDWLLKFQITGPAKNALEKAPDLTGSFRPQSGYNTASYLEGILDAWKLATELGERTKAKNYLRASKLAAAFVLRTQYTEENSYYLSKADRALGGFRKSLTDNLERCDFVQHASLALIKIKQYGIFK